MGSLVASSWVLFKLGLQIPSSSPTGSLELHLPHQASNLQWGFGDRISNPSLDLHNLFVRDSRF